MPPPLRLLRARIASPVGELTLLGEGARLVAIGFEGYGERALAQLAAGLGEGEVEVEDVPDPAGAASALARYFDGELDAPRSVAVDPAGTPFQKRVWETLRHIPPGTTISYGDLALRIGQPTASRAVAQACGKNPVPIVVPCHRVLGSDGLLVGYAGGLMVKARLLAHEKARPAAVESGDLFD